MPTVITSDGEGNWESAEVVPDEGDLQAQNRLIVESQHTMKGLPSYIEAKKIPSVFSKAFNKILECVCEGITYRYKELNFMELLAHGQNPYSLELTRLASERQDDNTDDILEDFELLPIEKKLELASVEDMRRKNLLTDSLVDMRVGDEVLEITAEIVNAMTQDTIESLFKVLTREGEAETEAVERFHREYGKEFRDSDLPAGEDV